MQLTEVCISIPPTLASFLSILVAIPLTSAPYPLCLPGSYGWDELASVTAAFQKHTVHRAANLTQL